jgi:hypothetical protein
MALTHTELVERARKWLVGTQRCAVVLTECGCNEIADAIGWKYNGQSILVECKVSRADFLRDKKKFHRRHPSSGMGMLRYYMASPKLISVDELPENWGLCEVHPKQVRVPKKAEMLDYQAISAWQERHVLIVQFARARAENKWERITIRCLRAENRELSRLLHEAKKKAG